MYCTKCGKYLGENAENCPLCGTSTSFLPETDNNNENVKQSKSNEAEILERNNEYNFNNNTPKFDNGYHNSAVSGSKNYMDIMTTYSNKLAVIGFILAFVIPLAGLILCIFGSKDSEKLRGEGKALSTAGIIISSLTLILSIILSIIFIVAMAAMDMVTSV